MVTRALQSLESYASLETQVCSLAVVGFAAGAVALGSTAGIICATSLIIAYGCLYNAYVTRPSQRIAQERIRSLEENLRNCQSEKLAGEQRALEQTNNLNREIQVLKEKNDNINQLASETNKQLSEIQRTVNHHYKFATWRYEQRRLAYNANNPECSNWVPASIIGVMVSFALACCIYLPVK